jgi:hypothetical protein
MPKRKRGTGGAAFTVQLPRELPVRRGTGDEWWLELDDRELRVSNLDKIFWPQEGYTKGDLIAYYLQRLGTAAPPPGAPPAHDETDARRHRRRFVL